MFGGGDREQVGGTIGDRALKKETQSKRSSQEALLLIPPGMGQELLV